MSKLRSTLLASALAGLVFCAAAPADSPQAQAPAPQGLRRFALVMGANSGGEGTARLRYAVSDARSFASVLTELGGVAPSDLLLLVEPGAAAFRSSVRRLETEAASAGASGRRCELVFYYSGHSDEEGLLLGRDRLAYAELRAAIERIPADVRVAILDSCSSGSLTRAKGGSLRPAFLFDSSSDMKGHAYLTSSSAVEAAQESDRIGGSFFTHYLVSALRGAADSTGQGRVTLNEAYAYAFRQTLASTENTQFGPQHPAYEIALTGSGDLVVTDLRSSRAGLILSEELSGSLFVRDAKGALALELDKDAGDRMELGLPPGKYRVAMVEGEARSQAEVLVSASSRTLLKAEDFRALPADPTLARGGPPASSGQVAGLEDRQFALAGFPVSLGMSLIPDLSRGLFVAGEDKVVSLNLLWGYARSLRGFQLSSLLNSASGEVRGLQLAGLANAAREDVAGAQLAGFANLSSGGLRGAQLSGFANVALGDSFGAQAAGFANVATGRSGLVQLAGFGNYARGGFTGAQIAGGTNISLSDARGTQVGLVNIAAYLAGTQVGLVNISDRIEGVPIGLVNIERGGILSPQVWTEGLSSLQAGFAFGTRLVYTLAAGGFGIGPGQQYPVASLGFGGRLTIGPFIGDLDLSWRERFGPSAGLAYFGPSARLEARALAGFPAKGPGFILGCALEAFVPGLSVNDDSSQVSAFRVEPRILAGAKL